MPPPSRSSEHPLSNPTDSGSTMPEAKGSPSCRRKRRLVIHMDVNGTIMPADPAGKKSVKSMLNILLSKQAYLKDEHTWWDGTPVGKGEAAPLLPGLEYSKHCLREYGSESSLLPAQPGLHMPPSIRSYPDTRLRSARDVLLKSSSAHHFTETPAGKPYQKDLEVLLQKLHAGENEAEKSLSPFMEATTVACPMNPLNRLHLLLPSFLKLLCFLGRSSEPLLQDSVIVVRTFGHDIPTLFKMFKMIAEPGVGHPLCPGARLLPPSEATVGTMHRQAELSPSELILWDGTTLTGDDQIQDFLETRERGTVLLIQDDYDLWSKANCRPSCGKPVFLDLPPLPSISGAPSPPPPLHLLFDDNVQMDENDSIACVHLREAPSSQPQRYLVPMGARENRPFLGTVLVQASLYRAIMDDSYFVDELQSVLERFQSLQSRWEQVRPEQGKEHVVGR